ncbi:fumarylacetoacetate hydrolase family protein [Brevibacillus choshinensis]|uniref:fumarylacetoacetate hydrolase family protein n=1 Tax=Brevibacillus choshinensis TaxID=54911 RepID=UPI002E1BFA53|nr:fumarylacetoacetate hydrolase family protein [Brevibacillus choshinensis]
MKFVTFTIAGGGVRAGWLTEQGIVDMNEASQGELPANMLDFLAQQEKYLQLAQKLAQEVQTPSYSMEEVKLLSPVPNPRSVRDFMAFELHILNAAKRLGQQMAPAWYEIPAFYFTNHQVIQGTGAKIARPSSCEWLDYELEIACVIGKEGKNIRAQDAEAYIFGYSILNDWSARDLQMKESKIGLGPAKGKDFATSIGPYVVTQDELEPYRIGDRFDLEMVARVNGKELSRGNFKDIYYTFGQMIERASDGVTLYPGDVIGSGTVGTGCLLELGPDVHRWLEPGDNVQLEITGLGILENTIE